MMFVFPTVKTAVYPLRLISGPNSSSGRLQVLRNGVWGRVCVTTKNKFNVSAGNAACKQLGYTGIKQVSGLSYLFCGHTLTAACTYDITAHCFLSSQGSI